MSGLMGRGFGIYPKGARNMYGFNEFGPTGEMWDRLDSRGSVQHYTNKGCNLTNPHGHYPIVPASLKDFTTRAKALKTSDFLLRDIYCEM